jgi:lysozyme family protein
VTSGFAAAREWILRPDVEGGYSNDPDDAGGETRWGISKRSYPALDIKNLTRDEAAEIYRRDYWQRCNCDELPAGLALAVFDGAVNQGPVVSIRLLQLAIESLGWGRLTADGIVGPNTLAGARACWREDPEVTLAEFLSYRATRYAERAREAPRQVKFLRGWMRRLFSLEAACLRLVGA